MTDHFKPTTTEDLRDVIAWAAAEETPLAVKGSDTKQALGCPVQAGHTLDLSGLSGVVFYEPAELVLSVKAGTPLLQVQQLLAQQNQMLAFEPPDWGYLLGGKSRPGSIGGMVATGLSGPRRFKAGAVRDHVLGATAVSGRGEVFVSGGRVVKNVTGYDLPKLLTGSWGTLAALAEMNLKVLPAPQKTRTLLLYDLTEDQALAAMTEAACSPHEVSGLAHLPAATAARSTVDYMKDAGVSVTAIRVEGTDISVNHRTESLRGVLGHGRCEELHTTHSIAFWQEVRDVRLLPGDHETVWRVSVPPSDAASVLTAAQADAFMMDAGGGVIWLSYERHAAGQGALLRAAIQQGHAMLMRAPEAVRQTDAVFHPQLPALAALSARVKASFDPKGILNPGRMGFAERGEAAE